jgi:hypothetical protein
MNMYVTNFCDPPAGSPPYPDWATASTKNIATWLQDRGLTTLPPTTSHDTDYIAGCQGALALAWQAGVPGAQAAAQWCQRLHYGKEYKYCIAVS